MPLIPRSVLNVSTGLSEKVEGFNNKKEEINLLKKIDENIDLIEIARAAIEGEKTSYGESGKVLNVSGKSSGNIRRVQLEPNLVSSTAKLKRSTINTSLDNVKPLTSFFASAKKQKIENKGSSSTSHTSDIPEHNISMDVVEKAERNHEHLPPTLFQNVKNRIASNDRDEKEVIVVNPISTGSDQSAMALEVITPPKTKQKKQIKPTVATRKPLIKVDTQDKLERPDFILENDSHQAQTYRPDVSKSGTEMRNSKDDMISSPKLPVEGENKIKSKAKYKKPAISIDPLKILESAKLKPGFGTYLDRLRSILCQLRAKYFYPKSREHIAEVIATQLKTADRELYIRNDSALDKPLAKILHGLVAPLEQCIECLLEHPSLIGTNLGLRSKMLVTAQRKNYGIEAATLKDKQILSSVLGEENCFPLERWEICNLDLLEDPEKVKEEMRFRREQKLLQSHLNCLQRFLSLQFKLAEEEILESELHSTDLTQSSSSKEKLEARIKSEEEKVLKYMREEQVKQQKDLNKLTEEQNKLKKKQEQDAEKQQEKAEAKLKAEAAKTPVKPRITLINFFRTPNSAPVEEEVNTNKPIFLHHEPDIITDEEAIQNHCYRFTSSCLDILSQVNSRVEHTRSSLLSANVEIFRSSKAAANATAMKDAKAEVLDYLKATRLEDDSYHLEAKELCSFAQMKFFQFFEDIRPPFHGTVFNLLGLPIKNFKLKTLARKVFRKLEVIPKSNIELNAFGLEVEITNDLEELDYEYDSGLEWEEPEDGESITSGNNDRDSEETDIDIDELDYSDGWLEKEDKAENQEEGKIQGPEMIIFGLFVENCNYSKLDAFSCEYLTVNTRNEDLMTEVDIILSGLSAKDKKNLLNSASATSVKENEIKLPIIPSADLQTTT